MNQPMKAFEIGYGNMDEVNFILQLQKFQSPPRIQPIRINLNACGSQESVQRRDKHFIQNSPLMIPTFYKEPPKSYNVMPFRPTSRLPPQLRQPMIQDNDKMDLDDDLPSPKKTSIDVVFTKICSKKVSKEIARYLMATSDIKNQIDKKYKQMIFFTERMCEGDDLFSHVSFSGRFYGRRVTITSVVVLTFDKFSFNEAWVSNCEPHSFDKQKLIVNVEDYIEKRSRPGCMMDVGRNEIKSHFVRWIKKPDTYMNGRNIVSPFISPQISGIML